jgi:hypothetical protein
MKRPRDLGRRDGVVRPKGGAKTQSMIERSAKNREYNMANFHDGLVITAGHPIVHNGDWKYPRDIVESKAVFLGTFYNLAVDTEHIIFVKQEQLRLYSH